MADNKAALDILAAVPLVVLEGWSADFSVVMDIRASMEIRTSATLTLAKVAHTPARHLRCNISRLAKAPRVKARRINLASSMVGNKNMVSNSNMASSMVVNKNMAYSSSKASSMVSSPMERRLIKEIHRILPKASLSQRTTTIHSRTRFHLHHRNWISTRTLMRRMDSSTTASHNTVAHRLRRTLTPIKVASIANHRTKAGLIQDKASTALLRRLRASLDIANRAKAAPIQASHNTHRDSKAKADMPSSNRCTVNNSRAKVVAIQVRLSMVLSNTRAVLLGSLDGSKLLCFG